MKKTSNDSGSTPLLKGSWVRGLKKTLQYGVLPVAFSLQLQTVSLASSNCDGLLKHGITNITKVMSSKHSLVYKWHSYCGIDYSSVSDTKVAEASVSIFGYGSGDAGYNSGTQRKKLNQWCNRERNFATNNFQLYEESRIISDKALDSYTQCKIMSRKQIKITVTPKGENDEFVHIDIDSTHDGDLRLLPHTASGYSCTVKMVENGKDIDPEKKPFIRNTNIKLVCTRDKPEKSENDGIGTIKFKQGFISVDTSGPSLPISFPKIVSEYRVTPSGSVMAFNRETCPAGWEMYEEAAGRVIIGSGKGTKLSPRVLGENGGAEKHTLTVAEMPAHSHQHFQKREKIERHNDYLRWRLVPEGAPNDGLTNSQATGGNYPHNNMQPFHVLTYCLKK